LLAAFPERIPRADVGPCEPGGDERRALGALEHGAVDRHVAASLEGGSVDAAKARFVGAFRRGVAACDGELGLEALELFKESARAEQEDAAVPRVAARGEEAARDLELGLLDEARDAEATRGFGERLGPFDVSVSGL